ncbi:hypothetical protein Tco_1570889 [Tanacetum coccineum]
MNDKYNDLVHRYTSDNVTMSSATSAVTYTSVYTDYEPASYLGSEMRKPVAPPSPDFIPGPRESTDTPVPQDEDEREPMVHSGTDLLRAELLYPEDDANVEDEDEEDRRSRRREGTLAPADSTVIPDTQDSIHQALIDAVIRITTTLHTTTTPFLINAITLNTYQRSGIDYGFVSTVDAEERRQGIRDVGYGIRDTWVDRQRQFRDSTFRMGERVDLLMGDRMTLQETVWMVEEEAYASREAWAHSIGLSQATHQELQTHRDHVYAHETHLQAHQTQLQLQSTLIQTQHQVHETRFQMQQAELAALRETDRRRQDQMRRARQPGPETRIPDHQDASGDADSHI